MTAANTEDPSETGAEINIRISRANFQEFLREVRTLKNVSIESIADGSRLLTNDSYDADGRERELQQLHTKVEEPEDFFAHPWPEDDAGQSEHDDTALSLSQISGVDCTVALKPLDDRLLQEYLDSDRNRKEKAQALFFDTFLVSTPCLDNGTDHH